jgi:hypothetical protein
MTFVCHIRCRTMHDSVHTLAIPVPVTTHIEISCTRSQSVIGAVGNINTRTAVPLGLSFPFFFGIIGRESNIYAATFRF